MYRYLLSFICASCFCISSVAQGLERNVDERLKKFFAEYTPASARIGLCKLDSFILDHDRRKLSVYPSTTFGYQPFTPENVAQIYGQLKDILPGPGNYYDITVYADGKPINELISNNLNKKKDKARLWHHSYKGDPWVQNISRPYSIEEGLAGRHIALWQSHG